jgi:hypothetical protein
MSNRRLTLFGLWVLGIIAVAWGFRLRAASAQARLDLFATQKANGPHVGEIQRLEKRNRVVADRVAELRAKPEAQAAPTTQTAQELLAKTLVGQKKYRALLDDPQMVQLTKATRSASVRIHYRELYRQLGLSPTQTVALEALLTEGLARKEDIRIVADALKKNMSDVDIRSLLDDEKRALESQEIALLGAEAFQRLQTFVETAPGRALVNDVAEALTFSADPLTADQKTKLLDLLKTYRNDEADDHTVVPVFDWDELQSQAATFLTERQRAELGSSIAEVKYREGMRVYVNMLQDWVQRNAPKDR